MIPTGRLTISLDLFLIMTGFPRGLCAERERHPIHLHDSATLGEFVCSGDPDDREPYRSERRRSSQLTSGLTAVQ